MSEETHGLGGAATRPEIQSESETDPTAEVMEELEALGAGAPEGTGEESEPEGELPAGILDDAPENVKDALRSEPPAEEPSEEQREKAKTEVDVLDYLLGNRAPEELYVDAEVEIGGGTGKLRFYFRQLDGDKILQMETDHGGGLGPFSQVDRMGLNAAIADAAVFSIEGKDGRVIDPEGQMWRAGYASGEEAWKYHFRHQFSVLDALVGEVRIASGFGQPQVARAEKVKIASAVGNS